MKKLIQLNIILWIIVSIIPSITTMKNLECFTQTIQFTIEPMQKEKQFSSRSAEPRVEKIVSISENSIQLLKNSERF